MHLGKIPKASGASAQFEPAPLDRIPVHANFKHHNGGPVLASPVICSVFVGTSWKSDADLFSG